MTENIQDNTQDKNNEVQIEAHVGDSVFVMLNSGCYVYGLITEIREGFISDDKISKCYRISITDDNFVDIWAGDIKMLNIYVPHLKDEYFKKMEAEYGVEFYDEFENMKEVPDIVNEFLVKGAWDRLNDEEKNTLIGNLCMSVENEVDLINAINMSRNRNNELHKQVMELLEKRTKAVQAVIDFQNDLNEKIDKIPLLYQYAYDYMYKTMGIDKLLKAI